MRVVIVVDQDRIAVRIVASDVPPIERAAKDQNGERNRQAATKKMLTRRAQPHRSRL